MIKVTKFTTSWCGPCKILNPIFEEIKQQFYGKIEFNNIDAEKNQTLAQTYNITSVPTVIIEKDDQLIKQIVGLKPKQTYIQSIESLL